MDKYIKIDAIYNTLTEYYHHTTEFQHLALREALSRVPAADVVPVRHGRWIVKGQDIYCSECNAESAYNPFGASKFSVYCPTCGALMDKDGDGDVV